MFKGFTLLSTAQATWDVMMEAFEAYGERNSGQSEYPSQKVDLHNVIGEVITHAVTRVTNWAFP